MHTHLTNTRNAAVEVIESTYPLEVVRYGLLPDTEGAGQQRGGCGMMRELRCLAERTVVSMGSDRRRFTPWGLEGGHHAAGAHAYVTSPTAACARCRPRWWWSLARGTCSGWRPPAAAVGATRNGRPASEVQRDVAEGLVSEQRARDIYGREPPKSQS